MRFANSDRFSHNISHHLTAAKKLWLIPNCSKLIAWLDNLTHLGQTLINS
ncbi:hypothetical protein HCG51_03895 [Tolypothrix sp. PCC 7910]|nr:hypothetical protein [Tolypothrix sp. PCC 7910]QIR35984.1 hypothetical protein HCG51_03895 [Tolypothrix sp. PCC 7910]